MDTANALSDFFHWDLHGEFTLHEAAALWVECDPSEAPQSSMPHGYRVIKEALKKALACGELDGAIAELNESPESEVSWDDCSISRPSLVAWARKRGVAPKFLMRDILPPTPAEAISDIRELPINCPEHLEPWVRLLLIAFEQHWASYDPSDTNKKTPSAPEVIKWLRKHKINGEAVPQDTAKVFSRLIRHPLAPKGRRRDTDDEKYGI